MFSEFEDLATLWKLMLARLVKQRGAMRLRPSSMDGQDFQHFLLLFPVKPNIYLHI